MSDSVSVAVSGSGGDVYRPPFTAVQWQELEHQALIYKYMVAGVPVPSDLVLPIRRSLEALSARFFNQSNLLGYCSLYGKKFDPEPGRCRRTDGKKWRCSKDAYHESKYCERHMNRGRNRSRKPVESQSSSQSLSPALSCVGTVNSTGSGRGSLQNVSSVNQSLYSFTNSGTLDFGSNVSKLHMDTGPYMINNRNLSYSQGLTFNVDGQSYPSGGEVRGLEMDSNLDNSWGLLSSQVSTNPLLKPINDSYLQSNLLQLNMGNAFNPMVSATSMSKETQQHCFFGSELGSLEQINDDQHSMLSFSNECPQVKEAWSSCDATTQLSMSMDPDFNSRNAFPLNDA
ncbi:growth-regulating factor 4-like [Rutidosis leptorrhynchoides]|uniref:growth-regulating factor 4-like n=1 Tax=Rutidosis leptorrhynchoides TaxID=125765 RepID=UPI003A993621